MIEERDTNKWDDLINKILNDNSILPELKEEILFIYQDWKMIKSQHNMVSLEKNTLAISLQESRIEIEQMKDKSEQQDSEIEQLKQSVFLIYKII